MTNHHTSEQFRILTDYHIQESRCWCNCNTLAADDSVIPGQNTSLVGGAESETVHITLPGAGIAVWLQVQLFLKLVDRRTAASLNESLELNVKCCSTADTNTHRMAEIGMIGARRYHRYDSTSFS